MIVFGLDSPAGCATFSGGIGGGGLVGVAGEGDDVVGFGEGQAAELGF